MFNNDGQLANMNMADYLERIGTGLILSNHDVFNFDFVPPSLVGRNEAQRKIASSGWRPMLTCDLAFRRS